MHAIFVVVQVAPLSNYKPEGAPLSNYQPEEAPVINYHLKEHF